MQTRSPWDVALLAATAAHAGFQLTVSCLVYPALASTPAPSWVAVHTRHSRRITPVVGLVYLAVAVTSVGALRAEPARATVAAVAAGGVVVGVTGLVAAPLHGRLAAGRDPVLVRRLLRADRARTGFALLALAAALRAALSGR